MAYCSDILNLQALYGGDRSAGPRARLASARERLAEISTKLDRLTDAMLAAADDGAIPATFVRRARVLEAQQQACQADVAAAERELAAVARSDLAGADEAWRRLAAGVEAQDTDARLQTRQLVADTFDRIVVYRSGVRPADTPKRLIDPMLLAKGGTARMLRINADGELIAAEDLSEA